MIQNENAKSPSTHFHPPTMLLPRNNQSKYFLYIFFQTFTVCFIFFRIYGIKLHIVLQVDFFIDKYVTPDLSKIFLLLKVLFFY